MNNSNNYKFINFKSNLIKTFQEDNTNLYFKKILLNFLCDKCKSNICKCFNRIFIDKNINFFEKKIIVNINNIYTGSSDNFISLGKKISHLYNVFVSDNYNTKMCKPTTKLYSNVRGSSRKTRPQKGTGKSRQGSSRTTINRGGVKAFGPNINKNYYRKINKKSFKLALNISLLIKYINSSLYIIQSSYNKFFKTKVFYQFLLKFYNIDKIKTTIIIVHNDLSLNFFLKFKNIKNLKIVKFVNLHISDILLSNNVILDFNVLKYFN